MIAELVFRVSADRDAASKWLEGIKQPGLYNFNTGREWKNLSPFSDRIGLNRLKAALGCGLKPTTAVPSSNNASYQGNVIFERHLVRFANIWGKGWKNERVSQDTIIRGIQPAFSLFLKGHTETRDWHGWYELEGAAVDFYKFAIRAVSQHGTPCISALAEAFKTHWQNHYWPTSWRREIALALYRAGDSKEVLIDSLDRVAQQIAEEDDIYARVSEYTDMAIIWAKIGEAQRAKKLLPKILKGSFGIYHRKDRQFSHWVSWLGRVANQHPELVQDDIRKFSAALVNLELSGRGRGIQEAAGDLIAITTSWNIEYGFKLVNWLFDKKGLNYGPGLTGLLQGMLNRNNPPCQEITIVTNKLLIPFEEYNPSNLPELLAYSCHKFSPAPDAVEQVRSIANSISTNLLPSNRYAWWEGIVRGLRKAGRDQLEYTSKAMTVPREKYVTHEPSLILHKNEKLAEEEARLKVNSVESLLDLIRTVKSTDHFRWLALIEPYLDVIDISQLGELYDLISPFDPQHNAVAAIANKFAEVGEMDKANTILASLLDSSDPKGWDLHWDGGSRQSTFKTLIAIDPSKWRPKALECLVNDYIGEYRFPSSLIWNLEEIVDIIFDKPELPLIWQEIANHIFQLSDFVDITELPTLQTDNNTDLVDVDYLIRFTFKLLDIAVPELAYMAHQAIIGFVGVSQNRKVLTEALKAPLSQIGLPQVKALSALQDIVDEYTDFVATFKAEISALCASNDLCVRFMALELASNLSIDATPVPEDRSKLPFAYKIELPKLENTEEAIPFSAIAPGETFPDFCDPLEMIRPLSNEAELIGTMAGIPLQNITTRTSDLMRLLVPEKRWNKVAEEEYREWMKGIELQLTYHRLRPQIAKLALSHVACELMDAGRISPSDARLLGALFRRSDSYMLPIEPNERPGFIEVPNAKTSGVSRNHNKWLENTSAALSHFQITDNQDRVILGELTKWCWLDWDKPSETRLSMVCHSGWPNGDTPIYPSSFFPSMMRWTANDYPNIKEGILKSSSVIYGSPGYVDHGGTKWLALNPMVGFSLNWSMAPDGLFRWLDDSGEIMAESIFWKDGPIGRQPPKMDDVCSDGWLVVATLAAVDAIRQLTGTETIKINAVVRSYGNNPYALKYETAETRNQWA